MTKEELKQEAEEKLLQAELDYCHELSNPCEPSELPYSELLRFETGYKRGYLASAEPREKRIAELEKENAELGEQVSYLGDNLRVARKDRENLQLDVAKGLKEFVKDSPATSLRYLANEKYVEQLTKAKEIIRNLLRVTWGEGWNYSLQVKVEAEKFLKGE